MQLFDDILDEIMVLWREQKDKATEAAELMDKAGDLMEECETIEAKMVEKLRLAKEMDPTGYEEFLQSFNPGDTPEERDNNENLDNI